MQKNKELVEVELPDSNEIEEIVYQNPNDVKAKQGTFKMLGLKYKYNDLEPYIDALTMETHYSKHHLGYANKLNLAVKDMDLKSKKIEDLLITLDTKNAFLCNNAGGYYNHNLFFEILSPKKNTKPSAKFEETIIKNFGSFVAMKKEITDRANTLLGSGWVWIIVNKKGDLQITQTTNQDNPYMKNAIEKGTPIFALDVWEHAYYLTYKNEREKYIENIFNIINWEIVSQKYSEAISIQ